MGYQVCSITKILIAPQRIETSPRLHPRVCFVQLLSNLMKGFLNKVQSRVTGGPQSNTSAVPSGVSTTSSAPQLTLSTGSSSPKQIEGKLSPSHASLPLSDAGMAAGGAIRGGEMVPRADITLPKTKEKKRFTGTRHQKMQTIRELPALSETPMVKREALFRSKLQLCCVLFDFEDTESDSRGKEIKRDTLIEIAEYVNTPIGQKIFTEALMPDIVEMVKLNLFRALPQQTDDYDPEEDEPAMESSWPHLQVVYEFFLRFIVSAEVNGKIAKKYIDQNFIRNWVDLFDAEDPRERDYVKTVLHRM